MLLRVLSRATADAGIRTAGGLTCCKTVGGVGQVRPGVAWLSQVSAAPTNNNGRRQDSRLEEGRTNFSLGDVMLQHAFIHVGLPLSEAKPSFVGFYFEKTLRILSSTRTSRTTSHLATSIVRTSPDHQLKAPITFREVSGSFPTRRLSVTLVL